MRAPFDTFRQMSFLIDPVLVRDVSTDYFCSLGAVWWLCWPCWIFSVTHARWGSYVNVLWSYNSLCVSFWVLCTSIRFFLHGGVKRGFLAGYGSFYPLVRWKRCIFAVVGTNSPMIGLLASFVLENGVHFCFFANSVVYDLPFCAYLGHSSLYFSLFLRVGSFCWSMLVKNR